MCPSLLCQSRVFSMFDEFFHITNFNICNTLSLEYVETSSLQPKSFPYYGVSLHIFMMQMDLMNSTIYPWSKMHPTKNKFHLMLGM
jgi:hypothetical protein